MAGSRYLVGIDLGTTNCAVAYVDTKGRDRPTADIRLFEITQLVSAGETKGRAMLPSFLYMPGPHELPEGATKLPWSESNDRFVGEFARIQGARIPNHLVSSAKSWLCHPGVDREAAILPWGTPPDTKKLSPVEASADYLKHIRDAWNARFAVTDLTNKLEVQEIFLTVPASFDEAARELTLQAAKAAGFTSVILLEEPQAAFYCWIVTHQDGWQKEVRSGELILVCDIGGGTTDFSLITVVETPTGPGFRRVAVGDHLMLGGDNIDLALAHHVETKLKGIKLDSEQWSALRMACRTAKEKLLGDTPPERWPVTIAGRGSKLIGGSIQSELTREEVLNLVVDGFFPRVAATSIPQKTNRSALQEFGLPFVADPAIPHHMAAFLRRHKAEAGGAGAPATDLQPAVPNAVLFNGGALTPQIVRDRIIEVLTSWAPEGSNIAPPRVLSNNSLDLAVAYGAAYYGVVRRGGGIRIGGGTARSFYVGVHGKPEDPPWVCVVPRDAQEGDELTIDGRDFDLLMGQPVAFPLASSSVRPQDKPGDMVASDPDSILELPPLVGFMRVGRKAKSEQVPVRLAARVTEVGTVELSCQSRQDERSWRLQIQLRGAAPGGVNQTPEPERVVLEQSEIDAASAAIRQAFGPPNPAEEFGPTRLVKRLEEALGLPREQWPPSALRALWDPMREVVERRTVSAQAEARWLNLAGYFLRPGIGFPLDEVRIKALWPLWHGWTKFPKVTQCWLDWWVLWRRVSAGLNRAQQEEVHRTLSLYLTGKTGAQAKKANRVRVEPHELAEMWRCAASLDRLPSTSRTTLGEALVLDLARAEIGPHVLWSLGRLGSRVPLYGPANTVVPAENAEKWCRALLARPVYSEGRETTDAAFALGQIARVSGDRSRDLSESLRLEVIERLQKLGASEATVEGVRAYHELEAKEQSQALGDALPIGLRLTEGAS